MAELTLVGRRWVDKTLLTDLFEPWPPHNEVFLCFHCSSAVRNPAQVSRDSHAEWSRRYLFQILPRLELTDRGLVLSACHARYRSSTLPRRTRLSSRDL